MEAASAEVGARSSAIAWEVRLAGMLPLPPFAVGALVALGLCAVPLGAQGLFGAPFWSEGPRGQLVLATGTRASVVLALLVGYTIGASRYLPSAIFQDRQSAGLRDPAMDVRSALALAPEDLRGSRIAGGLGVGAGLCLDLAIVAALPREEAVGAASRLVPVVSTAVLSACLGWLLARAGYFTYTGIVQESGRARIESLDLLDLRPLRTATRIGLRLALVWIGGSSISALLFLDPHLAAPVTPLICLGLGLGALALFLPARVVHRRIRNEKERELARIEPALRRARDAVLRGEPEAPGRLADLLSYRGYVAGVREWPLDGSALTRLGLYVLIPLASWVGGALVERALGSLLDRP